MIFEYSLLTEQGMLKYPKIQLKQPSWDDFIKLMIKTSKSKKALARMLVAILES